MQGVLPQRACRASALSCLPQSGMWSACSWRAEVQRRGHSPRLRARSLSAWHARAAAAPRRSCAACHARALTMLRSPRACLFRWWRPTATCSLAPTGPPSRGTLCACGCAHAHQNAHTRMPRPAAGRAALTRLCTTDAPPHAPIISTRILGRRTVPFPPFLIPNRVPHGFTPRS